MVEYKDNKLVLDLPFCKAEWKIPSFDDQSFSFDYEVKPS